MPKITRDSIISHAASIKQRAEALALDKSLDMGKEPIQLRPIAVRSTELMNTGLRLGDRKQRITVTAPAVADQEFSISHKLGRVPARFTYEVTAVPGDSTLTHADHTGLTHSGSLTHSGVTLTQRSSASLVSDQALGTSWVTVANVTGLAELGSSGSQFIFGTAFIYNGSGATRNYHLRIRKDAVSTIRQYTQLFHIANGMQKIAHIATFRATTGDNNTSYQLQAKSSSATATQTVKASDTNLLVFEVANITAGDLAAHAGSGITAHGDLTHGDHTVSPLAVYPSGTSWTRDKAYFKCTVPSVQLAITLYL